MFDLEHKMFGDKVGYDERCKICTVSMIHDASSYRPEEVLSNKIECLRCHIIFEPSTPGPVKFCGSKREEWGCAYLNYLDWQEEMKRKKIERAE